jgi:hypothetical protein
METKQLSLSQAYAVSNIENLISILNDAPDKFREIMELIDANKIAEHEDVMQYLFSLLVSGGYLGYAEDFAQKYNIRIAKLDE